MGEHIKALLSATPFFVCTQALRGVHGIGGTDGRGEMLPCDPRGS